MSGFSGADLSFPMIALDTFMPQANIKINLLLNSRINPKLLAHAQIFGQFDHNKTLLALPECKCIFN